MCRIQSDHYVSKQQTTTRHTHFSITVWRYTECIQDEIVHGAKPCQNLRSAHFVRNVLFAPNLCGFRLWVCHNWPIMGFAVTAQGPQPRGWLLRFFAASSMNQKKFAAGCPRQFFLCICWFERRLLLQLANEGYKCWMTDKNKNWNQFVGSPFNLQQDIGVFASIIQNKATMASEFGAKQLEGMWIV